MTRQSKILSIVFVLWPILVAVPRHSGAQTGSKASGTSAPAISLTIEAPTVEFKAGASVQLNVTVKNVSNKEIQIWRNSLGQEGFVYKIDVKDESGKAPQDTKFGRDLRGREDPAYLSSDTPISTSGAWITLGAGKSLTDPINVSRLYELKKTGRYKLQVQRFDDESKAFVKSNSVTFTVDP